MARYHGLDRPPLAQYRSYLAGLARGDLGTSIQYNAPVTTVLRERLPWSLLLIGTALTLATAGGMLAGIHSGWRRGGRVDRRLLAAFIVVDNLPSFFVAFVAAQVLAVKLGWFPLSGAQTPFSDDFGPLHRVGDVAGHLVLPATVLALQFATYQYLVMRAAMVGELGWYSTPGGFATGLPGVLDKQVLITGTQRGTAVRRPA